MEKKKAGKKAEKKAREEKSSPERTKSVLKEIKVPSLEKLKEEKG